MENASIMNEVTHIMLETMKKLVAGEIDSKTASAVAMNGHTIIDAANAETQFIRTVKALPRGGVFGNNLQYLEPSVDDKDAKSYEKQLIAKRKAEKIEVEIDEPKANIKSAIYGPTAKEWK